MDSSIKLLDLNGFLQPIAGFEWIPQTNCWILMDSSNQLLGFNGLL